MKHDWHLCLSAEQDPPLIAGGHAPGMIDTRVGGKYYLLVLVCNIDLNPIYYRL